MKYEISIYRHRERTSRQFSLGVRGGSGRGTVDQNNPLCDILGSLRKAMLLAVLEASRPVQSVSQRPFVSWDNHSNDGALTDGKVPNWESRVA